MVIKFVVQELGVQARLQPLQLLPHVAKDSCRAEDTPPSEDGVRSKVVGGPLLWDLSGEPSEDSASWPGPHIQSYSHHG